MTNYIPLKSVLRLIPKPLFEHSHEQDFISWMIDALNLLPSIAYMEPKIQILELIDGKIILPNELKSITSVSYLSKVPSQQDLSTFSACIKCPESEPLDFNSTNICRYPISYKLFLDSLYFQNNYTKLKYTGNISNPFISKYLPNRYQHDCEHTYTVDKNKILYTSPQLQNGFLAIEFETNIEDCNEELIIPDYQEVQNYLSKYATMKHWEERLAVKEESTVNIYEMYLRETEIAFKKAKGEIILRNTDIDNVEYLSRGQYLNLIKIPEKFIYGRTNRTFPVK